MDKSGILSMLEPITSGKGIKSILWYGNRRGRDIDLLVVYGGDDYYPVKWGKEGEVDALFLGEKLLLKMISRLDPVATEAITKGVEIYGKEQGRYRELLSKVRTNPATINYLAKYAERLFSTVGPLLKMGNNRDALTTLSFSLSYVLFARNYIKGGKVVSFEEIVKQPESGVLRKMRKKIRALNPPTRREVKKFFRMTRKALTAFIDMLKAAG